MTHAEFVAGYRAGRVNVVVDRAAAASFVSARLMLPLLLLPAFGAAVALALLGQWTAGGGVFVLALALRALVRASSRGFVLSRALRDAQFYGAALAAGILRVEPTRAPADAPA